MASKAASSSNGGGGISPFGGPMEATSRQPLGATARGTGDPSAPAAPNLGGLAGTGQRGWSRTECRYCLYCAELEVEQCEGKHTPHTTHCRPHRQARTWSMLQRAAAVSREVRSTSPGQQHSAPAGPVSPVRGVDGRMGGWVDGSCAGGAVHSVSHTRAAWLLVITLSSPSSGTPRQPQ